MNISINPLTWFSSIEKLRAKSGGFDESLRQLFNDVAQWAQQIQASITNYTQIAALLNGNGALVTSALVTSVTDLGSPAGNSTINTNQAPLIYVRVNWTTAANWTLNLNNVSQGAVIAFRLVNNSGASRTFTVTAKNPSGTLYSASLYITGSGVSLSAGATVANGVGIDAVGMAATAAGSPFIMMTGVMQ